MESRAHFFDPVSVLQTNYFYLSEINPSDIFTLNDEPILFLVHNGEPGPSFSPRLLYFKLTLFI